MKKVFIIELKYPHIFNPQQVVTAYIPEVGNIVTYLPCEAMKFDTYEEAETCLASSQTFVNNSTKGLTLHIEKIFIP